MPVRRRKILFGKIRDYPGMSRKRGVLMRGAVEEGRWK
jgi:hypothetical protein